MTKSECGVNNECTKTESFRVFRVFRIKIVVCGLDGKVERSSCLAYSEVRGNHSAGENRPETCAFGRLVSDRAVRVALAVARSTLKPVDGANAIWGARRSSPLEQAMIASLMSRYPGKSRSGFGSWSKTVLVRAGWDRRKTAKSGSPGRILAVHSICPIFQADFTPQMPATEQLRINLQSGRVWV